MGVIEYEAKPKLKANRKKRGIPSAARDYGISVTFSAKFKDEKKSIMPSWHRSERQHEDCMPSQWTPMAVALNHTTSRDCKFTKCIQTFMGKMAIVALSTEWHWRRGMRKRLPLSSSLSSLLQRIFLCQAGSLPARQQMPCQLLCWQPCRRHQVDTCGTFQRLPINSNTFSGDAKAIFLLLNRMPGSLQ